MDDSEAEHPRDPKPAGAAPSRYKSQKQRDWTTFLHYLQLQTPPLPLPRCTAPHTIQFLNYLDQFGKTRVHSSTCPGYGLPDPPDLCACPLRQAWGSLDSLVGRLRAAYEENGGAPDSNPFAERAVRVYLNEVRDSQAKARGIPCESKKRKRLEPKVGAAQSAARKSQGGGGDIAVPPPAAAPTTTVV